jgi:Ribosomal protein L30/L7E
MIAIVRIRGMMNVLGSIEETLTRFRLRRKYACVVIRENPVNLGMLKKIENFVAYGQIDKSTFIELIKQRGKATKGKVDAEKIVAEFTEGKTEKKLEDLGIKPFFRLHPPRGGIDSKLHYPKGPLGNNREGINELIRRML